MKPLSKKIERFTESIIRKMTRISDEYNSINLSQGFPDFDPPIEIMDALKNASHKGPHQYAITFGAQNFREALAKKLKRFMNMDFDPENEILTTCGSTEAMMCAVMTICDPKDKIIVFSPFYENYVADTILSGTEPIFVSLTPPQFNFDKVELENAFKQNPKAIIICNPSNPTGKVFSKEELLFIADMAKKYDTYVITDEVYEHIIFEPYEHTYFAKLPDMRERTICCSSLSKTYSITGWRLGYLIGPEKIVRGAKAVHDFLTVGAAAPLQEAAVVGLNFGDDYYKEMQKKYTHSKELFLNGLTDIGLNFSVPQGAYYVMVEIDKNRFENDYDYCVWLAKEVGVAAVPGSSFFKENINNLIRFHFAKQDATLIEALNRLKKIK